MQPATALLVSSTDLNWVGLRATLAGWPEMHVDDVQQRDYALAVAARERPDLILILVASDLAGLRLVPLVRDLREASLHSRVVVLGQPLDPKAHRQLDALGMAGFIHWMTVTTEALRLVIVAAVSDGKMQAGGTDVSRATLHVRRSSRSPLTL